MSCQVKGECFCFEIQFDVRNEHTLSTQRQTTLTFTLTHILRLCSICQQSWSWSWFFQVVGDFISSKLICCELFHNSMDILCGLMLQRCKLTSANCCLLCKVKLGVKCIELEKPRWNKHVQEHVQGAADTDDLLKSWKYFAVSFFFSIQPCRKHNTFFFFFSRSMVQHLVSGAADGREGEVFLILHIHCCWTFFSRNPPPRRELHLYLCFPVQTHTLWLGYYPWCPYRVKGQFWRYPKEEKEKKSFYFYTLLALYVTDRNKENLGDPF